MQTIQTKKQDLLNKNGIIENPGFAFTPIWNYNRENIKAPKWRIKEWDYYLITSKDHAVAFTISDLGYIGLISVSFLDLDVPLDRTKTILKPFPLGKFHLPRTSSEGVSEYHSKDIDIRFETKNRKRHISCFMPNFYNGETFQAEFDLEETYDDSMVIATPWKEKPTCFYYNQKINCLAAQGHVQLGMKEYVFEKEKDYGVLDWGRGVWTYDNIWYWGTGSGIVNGKTFGFNLGYGFSDRSMASENVVFYDGNVYKLSEVEFEIPRNSNGTYDFMKPWTITSDDNQIKGTIQPILDRNAMMDFKIILSDQHQVFGKFNGYVQLENEKIEVHDFLCAIEVVHNKY